MTWLAFRSISLLLWAVVVWLLWIGLIQNFDIGWLFIASIVGVGAATFWKNAS